MATLGIAISIAAKAFENKTDKGGRPYILHCLYVMNAVRHLGDEAMICAVLHDIIEDSWPEWTLKRLMEEGFSARVTKVLELLTHNPDDSYEDYVKKLSFDTLAKEIKKRDLEHNSKITRLKSLRQKDFDRLEKYCKAYTYLSE